MVRYSFLAWEYAVRYSQLARDHAVRYSRQAADAIRSVTTPAEPAVVAMSSSQRSAPEPSPIVEPAETAMHFSEPPETPLSPGVASAVAAAGAGHDVISSPTSHPCTR